MSKEDKTDQGSNVKISVTGLAEFVTAYGRSPESLLRPFKFSNRGEGFARSSYYQPALSIIRKYHDQNNSPKVFDEGLAELRAKVGKSTSTRERSRLDKNIDTVHVYRRRYENRRFTVRPSHRITYKIDSLTVTAHPDLWVVEDGVEVLLKLGIAKKRPSYIDLVLTIMRKAAVSNGYRIRSGNVVFLDVLSGRELICTPGLTRFNRTLREQARQIASIWPRLRP